MNPSKLLRPVASFITSLNIRTVYNIRAVYNMGNSNSSRGGEAAAKSEAPVSQEGEKAPTTTSRQGEKQAGPQEEEEEKPQKAKACEVCGLFPGHKFDCPRLKRNCWAVANQMGSKEKGKEGGKGE